MCGGGAFFISVAEIRYRHDLVRLCHKFHFCHFQMKISRIDEEKELYCVNPGLCLGFLFWGLGESIPKNFRSHAAARKNFLGLVGVQGHTLLKILKRYCSGLAEIAFLDISNLH